MSKKKYSKEFKLKVLKEHEKGASFYSLEKKYDIVLGTVKRWNAAFKAHGETALDRHNSNLCRYSAEFKQRVVSDYLSGGGSFESIAVKYGIHAESTVLKWVAFAGGTSIEAKPAKPQKRSPHNYHWHIMRKHCGLAKTTTLAKKNTYSKTRYT